MRVTMNDIAKKLNVSVNTVSKALGGKAKISEDLRKKIIKTAKEMGYVKNQYAARLSTTPVKIGVIVCGYDENYYRYTLEGLEKAFSALADGNIIHETVLFEVDNNIEEKVYEKLSIFEKEGFKGVIINDFHSPLLAQKINEMTEMGIEIALLNYDVVQSKRSFSVTNNYSVSAMMAAEMLSIGLRYSKNKSVMIGTMNQESYGQMELCKEFIKGTQKFGLKTDGVFENNKELIDSITPDTGGIYITHAKSVEVIKKIEKIHKQYGVSPVLIVSDLYKEMIPYIESGIVTATVYQNPVKQAYDSVLKMFGILSGIENKTDIKIKPELLMRSNYNEYL